MNRDAFIGWAFALLQQQAGLAEIRREGSNNTQAVFFDDVHIGIVATTRAGYGDPGPRIRVHIWSEDPGRRSVWQSGGVQAMQPPYPTGCQLVFRPGPMNPARFYLEFGWDNDDLNDFTPWLARVQACVQYFVAARNNALIP